jgi:hypothetical protein
VLSLVTDPNDYAGPAPATSRTPRGGPSSTPSGSSARWPTCAAEQARGRVGGWRAAGPATAGSDPRDVVVGVSPGVGREVWTTLSGLSVADVLDELLAGLEEEGCTGRVVRVNDTIDLGLIGLTAARLAGSGISIGLQGKGTALIHRRDLAPLANLELYSVAPLVDRELYRLLGTNAGRHAKGATPLPARNPYIDEAIEARYPHRRRGARGDRARLLRAGRRARRAGGAPMTVGFSGRDPASVTLDAVRDGDVGPADIRIHPDTLRAQAAVAREHGNPQLAANFERAAELAGLPDDECWRSTSGCGPGARPRPSWRPRPRSSPPPVPR